MRLSDELRHNVEHNLADYGLHPTEAAMITVHMILAAVDLADSPAIPGLKVKVSNRHKLCQHLIALAMASNPRRGDSRATRADHKQQWGDQCPFLYGPNGEVTRATRSKAGDAA